MALRILHTCNLSLLVAASRTFGELIFFRFELLLFAERTVLGSPTTIEILTKREVIRNLQAICMDADKTPLSAVARTAIGVLTTENRKTWSSLRHELAEDKTNAACLRLVDDALFVVCLDDAAPGRDGVGALVRNGEKGEDLAALCSNFLCGGVQVGTCTNRCYKLLYGAAGINFEHTGVDGHTVLRYILVASNVRFAAHVFTEGLMLLARSTNPSAPTLFHASLSPHAKSYKPPKSTANGNLPLCSQFLVRYFAL
ncbi:CoA-dependent acyltransferase [Suillus brevipes Sb2]|nr:CoA-dependent acyltransferase [Suillus brevipes Sb2]